MSKEFWDERDFEPLSFKSEDDGQLTIFFDSNEPPDPDDYENLDDFDRDWEAWEDKQTGYKPSTTPDPDNEALNQIKDLIRSINNAMLRAYLNEAFMCALLASTQSEFSLTQELGSRLGSAIPAIADPNLTKELGSRLGSVIPAIADPNPKPSFIVPNDLHRQCQSLGLPSSYADKAIKIAGGKGTIEIKRLKGNYYAYLRREFNGTKKSSYLGVAK